MRIVLDARMVKMSGIGRYIDSLIPFLAVNFDLTLLGNPGDLKKYGIQYGIHIIRASSRPYSPLEQTELPLKIPSADLFWTPHFNAPILPIKAAKRIVTIHDVFHLTCLSKDGFFRRKYAMILYSNAIKRSDAVFTVSEFTKTEIGRFFPRKGKYLSRIRVIPRYPDPKFRKLDMTEESIIDFMDKTKLPARFVLYVGNIKPHKNIAGLLRAFDLIRKTDNSLHLVCVGQKNNFLTGFNGMQNLIRSLGLESKVFFTGILDDEKLVKIYNSAQVLVLPSFYEGFGLPSLEAMACGCPVVASSIPPLREVCSNAAVYVDPHSEQDIAGTVLSVINDKKIRKHLIKEGLTRAAEFKREKIERKYIMELESIFRNM